MNRSVIPKLVNLLLILAFITPLLYGLYLYDWDIEKFIGFKGSEVYIDLSFNVDQVYTIEQYLVFTIEIKNIGDLPVNLTRLDAALNATFDKQMHFSSKGDYTFIDGEELAPGQTTVVEVKFLVKSATGGVIYFRNMEYVLDIAVEAMVLGNPVVFSSTLKGGVSQ